MDRCKECADKPSQCFKCEFESVEGPRLETRPRPRQEPRQCHDQRRSVLILDAMRRYVDAGKDIPMEWIDELRDYQL